MSSISAAQIRAIHTLKDRAGLSDDMAYRDFLQQTAGTRSSKALSEASAGRVIERLKALAGDPSPALRAPSPSRGEGKNVRGALNLSGPYAGICRALWISGYELGVFAAREDTALQAFVTRQTRIDSLNWVRDAKEGAAVIEALKKWLSREAGVVWPARKADSAEGRKLAVLAAQLRLLGERDAPSGDLDAAIRTLGRRIRARQRT